MLLKEYRILVPMTLDEFQRGAKFNAIDEAEQTHPEDLKVEASVLPTIKEEIFIGRCLLPDVPLSSGKMTHRLPQEYQPPHSKLPWYMRLFTPKSKTEVHIERWDAWPYRKVRITNPGYLKQDGYLLFEVMHIENDLGKQENVFCLTPPLLEKREVINCDILDTSGLDEEDLSPETDPKVFRSLKANRGPLREGWEKNPEIPHTAMYCVLNVHFKMDGLQELAENLLHDIIPTLLVLQCREIFCSMDRWYDMNLEEVSAYEAEAKRRAKAVAKRKLSQRSASRRSQMSERTYSQSTRTVEDPQDGKDPTLDQDLQREPLRSLQQTPAARRPLISATAI
ncbi:Phosphatidylinositol transfer protein domain containing protein [Aphelenchoides fujianensis]|nr:Phosphatidylinositol transfer protein domain containing protein [Aphelenchoides fujianensis]